MTEPTLYIRRLHPNALIPTRGSEQAIGLDIHALAPGSINPGKREIIATGIAVAIPSQHYGRLAPRSGLAAKSGIAVFAGVLDEDYRGEIKVILANHGEEVFNYAQGDRIAQLILERASIVPVHEVERLPKTERGEAGIGSTGVSA